MRDHRTIHLFARLAVLALVLVLAGCATMNVRHLNRVPWTMGETEEVALKFWRFAATTTPEAGGFRVSGTAYPNRENLPEWAEWIDELWFAAYVCDKNGNVLADEVRVYLPGPLAPEAGTPFDFLLKPEKIEGGALFLTFGYRMTLADSRPAEPGSRANNRRIFFASESAVDFF